MPQQPAIQFIDNPHAPAVLVDEAFGFFVNNGVVQITFVWQSGATVSRIRRQSNGSSWAVLAMPVVGAQGLAAGIYDFLEKSGTRSGATSVSSSSCSYADTSPIARGPATRANAGSSEVATRGCDRLSTF